MGSSTTVIFRPFFSSSSWIKSNYSWRSLIWFFNFLLLYFKCRFTLLTCFTSFLNGIVHLINCCVLPRVFDTLSTCSSQTSFIFSKWTFRNFFFLDSFFIITISWLANFNCSSRSSNSVFFHYFLLSFLWLANWIFLYMWWKINDVLWWLDCVSRWMNLFTTL